MLRGVIFDFGSTILRTLGDDRETLARMQADMADHLIAAGVPLDRWAFIDAFATRLNEFHAQRLRDWVEVTSAYVLREAVAGLGLPPLSDDLADSALKAYYAYNETRWEVMPGAPEALAGLAARGLRLGLISNAGNEANILRLLDQVDLRHWFDPIVISASAGVRKPNPRIFEIVLDAWGLPAAEVVMVGDSLGADVLGAQLVGMRSVWLASRSDAPANEAHQHTIQPDATIYELSELAEALEAFETS